VLDSITLKALFLAVFDVKNINVMNIVENMDTMLVSSVQSNNK
jgi:hypothetical protein